MDRLVDKIVPFLEDVIHGGLNDPIPVHILDEAMSACRRIFDIYNFIHKIKKQNQAIVHLELNIDRSMSLMGLLVAWT